MQTGPRWPHPRVPPCRLKRTENPQLRARILFTSGTGFGAQPLCSPYVANTITCGPPCRRAGDDCRSPVVKQTGRAGWLAPPSRPRRSTSVPSAVSHQTGRRVPGQLVRLAAPARAQSCAARPRARPRAPRRAAGAPCDAGLAIRAPRRRRPAPQVCACPRADLPLAPARRDRDAGSSAAQARITSHKRSAPAQRSLA
jgi:hypothetical protein